MWDEEEDYRTPGYLLWTCVGLGSILGVMSAGGLIKALMQPDWSGTSVALLVLVIVMAFFLVSTGLRTLRDAPNGSDKD